MTVRFVNKDTGEIREQTVFMGDFPMMTEHGTFIINGTERVIVTQLVRSPGAYLMEPKDATKQVFTANLMPSRGSWLELEIDKKGIVYARIDRKRKLPVTTLLRALPAEDPSTGFALDTSTNEAILALFGNSPYIVNTLDKDPSTREEEALIEVFKKQRPGEPPTLDNARNLLRSLFFDPKRYDLTKVGRYKLNQRLGVTVPEDCRVLTTEDIVALVRKLIELPVKLGLPEDSKDFAAEALAPARSDRQRPRRVRAFRQPPSAYRRRADPGGLPGRSLPHGTRRSRADDDGGRRHDHAADDHQHPARGRSAEGVLRLLAALAVHGSDELARGPHAPSPAQCTRSRWAHERARPDRGARRPPDALRPHVPDRDAGRPEHRTHRLPRLVRDRLGVRLHPDAVPEGRGRKGLPRHRLPRRRRGDEVRHRAGERPTRQEQRFVEDSVLCRSSEGEAVAASPKDVELMDVSPAQIVSVSTALIPFLEHNDANRALMGANMQRQAVPLLVRQAPLVGTGLEYRAAVDSGDVVIAEKAGTVVDVDATRSSSNPRTANEYPMIKFMRSNQGTLIHQKPIVLLGDKVGAGQVIADGSSTDTGELALGANLLVAFMPFEGFNFEDAIVLSERLVKDDILTSIHIHEYEIDARSTKLGDEEITRDIPNRSEESLSQLDERGVVRIGAEVGAGDLLVGKVTPKGETELTAEEKLIRAIFKEKAREVRDTSLKVPHGEGGVVIDVKTFDRASGDDLSPGVNELVRVFVATKRKIAEGDKLAGRHGNKGVISRIVPEEDMPFLPDGRPVDIVLNPLGVPSRMNIGQVLETHLGWAAAHGVYSEETPNGKRGE